MQRELPSDHTGTARLLQAADPDPVGRRAGARRWLLTVEHAGRAIPQALGDLCLPAGEIDRHIGWDIGALELGRAMADRLGAGLIAQRYSRIVIDCNRPWEAPDLVPETTDVTRVGGNTSLTEAARRRRWDEIHAPFHAAVAAECDRGLEALIAVHSYDRQRALDAAPRPWPIGLLWRRPNRVGDGLARALAQDPRAAPLGLNMPYEIEDESDYTIPVHGEARGIPHVLIEVRNDYLRDAAGVATMAEILCTALLELE